MSVKEEAISVESAQESLPRNFWRILGGQWISQLGDGLYVVALPMFILDQGGAALGLGFVMAAAIFPLALLSPFAGVLADRWQRKRLLVAADVLSGIVAFIVAYLAWVDRLSTLMLFLAGAALSAASAFFLPSLMASLPNLVPSNRLTQANSLLEFGRSSSQILGPALGGVLVTTLGFPLAFLLNAFSFWVSALVVSLSTIPQTQTSTQSSILSDLSSGVKYIMQNRTMLSIAVIFAVLNFFEPAVLPVIMPIVADQVLEVGDVGYGVMRAVHGLGGIAALIALSVMIDQSRRYLWLAGCIAATGGLFVLMGLSINLYPALLVTLFLYGVLISITNILVLVIAQTIIPDEERGKVFGLVATIAAIMIPISFLTTGLVLDSFSPVWVLVVSAVAMIIGAIALLRTPGIKKV